jgi:hypothetical protein
VREFGLDVIALIGALRYTHHRSIPEIHRELLTRSVLIAERTVTNLLARYEELVTLHLTDQTRLGHLLLAQGSVILAASMDCNQMWGTKCCGSFVMA